MNKILTATKPAISYNEIKLMIAETSLKTAEFCQKVIEHAALTRAKSCKNPKALLELWAKRELPLRSLAAHVGRVHAIAPKKAPKAAKAPKVKAEKAPKAPKVGTVKPKNVNKARAPRKGKKALPVEILAICDTRQGELQLCAA